MKLSNLVSLFCVSVTLFWFILYVIDENYKDNQKHKDDMQYHDEPHA